MAERSGFFNASKSGETYSPSYDAEDFANYFSLFVSDGVFVSPANQLKVVAGDGLNVVVKAGHAFIEGYWYELSEDKTLPIAPNVTGYQTQSKVCATLDRSTGQITSVVTNAVSEITPVNDGSTHELVLATVAVGVGVSAITDAVITDRRPDKSYCGFVVGMVDQIDTSDLFLQFETAFTEWFDSIKGKLGEDPATQLQSQIDAITEDVSSYKTTNNAALQGIQQDISTLQQDIEAMPDIRSGTSAPSNSVGKDGDVYVRITG